MNEYSGLLVGTLLEIGCVHSNAIEEPFWIPKEPFSAQFLKYQHYLNVKYFFSNLMKYFSTLKNLLCNEKFLWMLKDLREPSVNKEPLFLNCGLKQMWNWDVQI